MSDLKIQGEVSLDTSNAEQAFGRVEQGAGRMAQSVAQAGTQAGKAVDSIGSGGDASAKKVDAATRSMIQSIQRTTAMMEAGSKSNARYYETLAAQRGVDVNALKPYLDQLDAVAAKQKAAEQALNATTPALNNVGMSAKQTAFAMRQIPAQFTDIVTSLQAGQTPMTVLIQQGGQLKDSLGGVGPAAKAVGGYVAGLINPFTVAAVAAGGLAYAYHEGSQEASAYSKALIQSGNAVGANAIQMADMAARIDKVVGTQSQAAAGLVEFVNAGAAGAGNLERYTRVALEFGGVAGAAVSDVAKRFAELKKSPVEASLKLNESMNYLTASTYEQIKALAEQGKATEAANLAQNTFADTLEKRKDDIRKNLGIIETGWLNIKKVISEVVDSALSVGRIAGPEAQLATAQSALSALEAKAATRRESGLATGDLDRRIEAARQYVESLTEQIRLGQRASAAESERNRIQAEGLAAIDAVTKANDRALTKQEQMNKALAEYRRQIGAIRAANPNSALLDPNRIAKAEAAIRDSFKESGGGNSEVANLKARIQAEQTYLEQLKTRGLEAEKLNEGEKRALELQEQLKGKLDAKTRAEKEAALAQANTLGGVQRQREATEQLLKSQDEFQKARDREMASLGAEIVRINEKAQAIEDEVAMYGLSRTAIDSLAIARLEEKRAALLQFEGSEERIALLDQEIEARKRLATAMDAKDAKDEAKKAADHAAAEWKRASDDVERSLTNAIMRGGKNAGEYLRDYFRTLTLRPVIQAVMSPVSGAVASIFAPSSAMAGGTGGAGGAMSWASAGKSLWDGFSTGFGSYGNSVMQYAQYGYTGLTGGTAAVSTGAAGTGWVSAESGAGYVGNGMGAAGTAAGIAAGIAGGVYGGRLISGGYSLNGGSGNSTVNTGTAIGAAVGSIVPVIGTALGGLVGGLIGGVVNRAFGRGPKKVEAFGIEGDFTAEDFSGRNFSDWKQKGGWFSSSKRGTDFSMLDPTVIGQFSDGVAALRSQTESFADALGLSADSVAGYSKHIRLTLTNDQAENQKLITQLFGSIGDEMAGMVGDLSVFARAGETTSGTLQRLATSITVANDWLSRLQQTLFQTSVAGGDAASKLADAFGGLQNLAAVSAAFYQAYYTEGERAARSREDMRKALETVNLSLPESMAELRQMAGALDLTTESGRNAYVTLLSIAPEFANVAQATARAAKEMAGKLLAAFNVRGTLVPAMQASGALNDEIYALGKNAADAVIDIDGLGEALADVDTETFVETMAQVFENLANRIGNVIGDIASERGAVREAALQILNPAGMSKEAIRAGIAGINTALPSNAGLAGLSADFALVDRLKAAQSAALSPYRAAQDALSNFRNTVAPGTLQNAQLVMMNGNVPTANAELYANNAAYRQAWDTALAGHQAYFGKGYDEKSDAYVLQQGLEQMLAPAMAAERAAFEQQVQQQTVAVDKLKANYQAATDALNQAQTGAAEQAKAAQLAYAEAMQNFAIEAGQSVNKLSRLREETLKYYEAQKQLADLMTNSAAGLRKSLTDYRYSQLSPEDQFTALRSQFASAYSMSLSTSGETLAGYADTLNGLINPLLDKAREVYGEGADYNAIVAAVFGQAQSIASRLETLTPTDYAADSLELLEQIDATLAELESSTRSAEELVVAAINASRDQTAGGLRAVVAAITGQTIPAFAVGGYHAGGLRLVGENGPELEATGPSRIYSASQTRDLLSGSGNAELVAEVRALRQENADLHTVLLAIATHTNNTARRLERIEADGMVVRTEDDMPLKTEAVA